MGLPAGSVEASDEPGSYAPGKALEHAMEEE